MGKELLICAGTVLFMSFCDVKADEHEFVVGTINSSWHWNRDKEYNESHYGVFLQYNNVMISRYLNSVNKNSTLVAYTSSGLLGKKWLSWQAGGVTGYEEPIRPFVGLMAHHKFVYVATTYSVSFIGLRYEFK